MPNTTWNQSWTTNRLLLRLTDLQKMEDVVEALYCETVMENSSMRGYRLVDLTTWIASVQNLEQCWEEF